jgi:hypothetical protein
MLALFLLLKGMTDALAPFSYLVLYTCKCIFGVGTPCGCMGTFTWKEGRIKVLAGLSPSSQTVASLFTIQKRSKSIGKKFGQHTH